MYVKYILAEGLIYNENTIYNQGKSRGDNKQYPTPFISTTEEGIRQRARDLYKAFSWNKGFKEYFAVKATPNPFILKILKEEGCGVDCSSLTELMMSDCSDSAEATSCFLQT